MTPCNAVKDLDHWLATGSSDRTSWQPSPAKSASARERTTAGLQRAKAQGRGGGRPRIEGDPRIMANLGALRWSGASIRHIASELGLSPTTSHDW
jgi:hypothetical protein